MNSEEIPEGFEEAFFSLHTALPREGPGGTAETLRALEIAAVPPSARMADMGCGPGASATVLLEARPEGTLFACDLHAPFVTEARRRAKRLGATARLDAQVADMLAPPLEPASLDLIWCEGAIYNVGVAEALTAWRPLLAPGGRAAFSEVVRKRARMSERAEALWEQYPAMTDHAGVRARIEAAGWRLIDAFDLPDACWDAYYGPLESRADALEARLRRTEGGRAALAAEREEVAVWRGCRGEYGYAFFIVEPA
ncbi:MAG: class I SAM-dependent methyltransferase [Pseudomonadota bacterium]